MANETEPTVSEPIIVTKEVDASQVETIDVGARIFSPAEHVKDMFKGPLQDGK